MQYKFKILFVVCSFASLGFSQTKTDSISTTTKVSDSIIDGKSIVNGKIIPAEQDTLDIKNLKDHPEAAELDQKWLEEL